VFARAIRDSLLFQPGADFMVYLWSLWIMPEKH